jgi:hypothetical protein
VTQSIAAAATAASAALPPRSSIRSAARVASGWLVAAIAWAATAGGRPKANRNGIAPKPRTARATASASNVPP